MNRAMLKTLLVGAAVAVAAVAGFLIPAVLLRPAAPPPRPGFVAPRPPPLAQGPGIAVGSVLPDATLEGFAGAPPVSPASYRGRPLVLNLWATWCSPCAEEMPAFQEVFQAAGDQVAFLGVDVDDAPSLAQAFVKRLGVTYDLAIDPEREFQRRVLRDIRMPHTLLIDPDGVIVHRELRPLNADELRRLLAEHLAVKV